MRTKEDFKSEVGFIMSTFLKLMKESDIGFGVTVEGNLIFFDQLTGNELYILKDDLVKAYEDI